MEHLPYAKIVSVVCEHFGCLPSEAEAELDRDAARDEPLLFDVIEVRAFEATARAYYAAIRASTPLEDDGELMQSVVMLDLQIRAEHRALAASQPRTPQPE